MLSLRQKHKINWRNLILNVIFKRKLEIFNFSNIVEFNI